MENKYLMLIRHFETYYDKKNNEKIKFDESFKKADMFVKYIKKFIDKYPDIKKIKFYTSDQDRTIMTSLVLSSILKSEIIKNNIKNIKIYDPIIDNIIDRDPKKNKSDKICQEFQNMIKNEMKENTLHIYITHSSIIYNLFKCILYYLFGEKFNDSNKKIHNYSISYVAKNYDKIHYNFNKKID